MSLKNILSITFLLFMHIVIIGGEQIPIKIFLNTTVDGANIHSDVYDFPVLIRLNGQNFSFDDFNGSDIKFFSSENELLCHYIERFDKIERKAEIFVKVPVIYANNNTQFIQMLYGDNEIPPEECLSSEVFDNNCASIWLMDTEPIHCRSDAIIDRSGNENNGTAYNMSSSKLVDGKVGNAIRFDGYNDFIWMEMAPNINELNKNFTVSCWMKTETLCNYHKMFSASKYYEDGFGFGIKNNKLYYAAYNRQGYVFNDFSLECNRWYHVAATMDENNNVHFYVDGEEKGVVYGYYTPLKNTSTFFIGATTQTYTSYVEQLWKGTLDQICISSTNRSSDWIKLEYENQRENQQFAIIPQLGFSSTALSDFGIYIDVLPVVSNLDLSGGNPSSDVRVVREMTGVNATGTDIIHRAITEPAYLSTIWHTMEMWKQVLPELNYYEASSPTASGDGFNFYIEQTGNVHGSCGGNNIWLRTNYAYDPATNMDGFFQTIEMDAFTDRDEQWELLKQDGMKVWININGSTAAQRVTCVKHGLHGCDIRTLVGHETFHGWGIWDIGNGYDIAREKESFDWQCLNRSYNDRIVRELDIAMLKGREFTTSSGAERHTISYPYIARFITMENNPSNPLYKNSYYTNSYYDARFRMYETDYSGYGIAPDPSRFYALHYDSVMVSTVADEDDLRSGPVTQFEYPLGLFVDNEGLAGDIGAIYVGVFAQVRKIDKFGNVSIFAGTGEEDYVNGDRLSAKFDHHTNPHMTDNDGNIYICENTQHRIRKIDILTDQVSLFAGSDGWPGESGYVNGTGSETRFDAPASIAYDNVNDVIYVADRNNHSIRQISMTGDVTTYISTGLQFPTGLAIDNLRRILYISEWGTNAHSIKMVDLRNGRLMYVAGSTTPGFVDGVGTAARFNTISDIDVDEQGNVWVADGGNNAIRRITAAGLVTTIAGDGSSEFADGSGTYAKFKDVVDVTCDRKGNVFVTDLHDKKVRKISWAIPVTVNAPAFGKRLNSLVDAHYYTFTINEAMDYILEVSPGNVLSDFNFELFGPDNDYSLLYSDLQTTSVNHTINLNPGSYKIRISKTNCNPQCGAYLLKVHDGRDLYALSGTGGIEGNIEFDGDNDWYELDLPLTGTFSVEATNISSSLNGNVHIYLYKKNVDAFISKENQTDPNDPSNGSQIPVLQGSLPTQDIPDCLVEEGINQLWVHTLIDGHYWVRVRAEEVNPNRPWEFTTGTYTIRAQ